MAPTRPAPCQRPAKSWRAGSAVRRDMLQKYIEFHVFCYMLRVAFPRRSAMYTQALNTAEREGPPIKPGIEDAARAAQFQARIDAADRVQPNAGIPPAYRKTPPRQISQHAD